MSSVTPFAFNAVELYVVTVNGKHWTRAKEVCKALEYQKTTKTAQVVRAHCSSENMRHMRELKGVVSPNPPLEWPKNSQPDEYYINEEGTYELVFSSQKQKAKAFRKYCCNKMFPKIRKQLTDKLSRSRYTYSGHRVRKCRPSRRDPKCKENYY